MKHQQVSVDYWAMGKTMLTYVVVTAMGWLMLRLFNMVFLLPRRMRSHQESLQDTLAELQRRFPGVNITEEEYKNAEKELEQFMNEEKKKIEEIADDNEQTNKNEDSKKTI